MTQDTAISRPAKRPNRTYSAQFKAQLVALSLQPGASVSALAREYDMSTSVLFRWRQEHRQGRHQMPVEAAGNISVAPDAIDAPTRVRAASSAPAKQGFVALDLPSRTAWSSMGACAQQHIHIECLHQGLPVSVRWPAGAAADCVRWLREWLR